MNKKIILTIFILFLLQIGIASTSSFSFYHGWNSAVYSLFGENYLNGGSLLEQKALNMAKIYDTITPLYGWLVFISFKLFGISDFNAQLVTVLSEFIAVFGIWMLTRELYSERVANISSIVFMILPWNVLWFSRVGPEGLLVALMVLSVALYVRAYRNNGSMIPFGIVFGLGVLNKQPALIVLPMVLIWSWWEGIKKDKIISALIWSGVGMIPVLLWLSVQQPAVAKEVIHIILGIHPPFADVVRVSVFMILGASPLLIFARKPLGMVVVWLIMYGTLALVRTPPNHEYYSLPVMVPLAIMIGDGISRLKWNTKVIAIMVVVLVLPFTYGILHYAGSFNYHSTEDVAEFVNGYTDDEREYKIYARMIYSPQMYFYFNDRNRQMVGDGWDLNEKGFMDATENDGKISLMITDERTDKYKKLYSSKYDWDILRVGWMFEKEKELSVYLIEP